MTKLTQERLAQIRENRLEQYRVRDQLPQYARGRERLSAKEVMEVAKLAADFQFEWLVAHSRTDIPALLSHIEAQEAENRQLRNLMRGAGISIQNLINGLENDHPIEWRRTPKMVREHLIGMRITGRMLEGEKEAQVT